MRSVDEVENIRMGLKSCFRENQTESYVEELFFIIYIRTVLSYLMKGQTSQLKRMLGRLKEI